MAVKMRTAHGNCHHSNLEGAAQAFTGAAGRGHRVVAATYQPPCNLDLSCSLTYWGVSGEQRKNYIYKYVLCVYIYIYGGVGIVFPYSLLITNKLNPPLRG